MPSGVDDALIRMSIRRAAHDVGPRAYFQEAENQIAYLEIKNRNLQAIMAAGILLLALAAMAMIYIYYRLDWALCLLTAVK